MSANRFRLFFCIGKVNIRHLTRERIYNHASSKMLDTSVTCGEVVRTQTRHTQEAGKAKDEKHDKNTKMQSRNTIA